MPTPAAQKKLSPLTKGTPAKKGSTKNSAAVPVGVGKEAYKKNRRSHLPLLPEGFTQEKRDEFQQKSSFFNSIINDIPNASAAAIKTILIDTYTNKPHSLFLTFGRHADSIALKAHSRFPELIRRLFELGAPLPKLYSDSRGEWITYQYRYETLESMLHSNHLSLYHKFLDAGRIHPSRWPLNPQFSRSLCTEISIPYIKELKPPVDQFYYMLCSKYIGYNPSHYKTLTFQQFSRFLKPHPELKEDVVKATQAFMAYIRQPGIYPSKLLQEASEQQKKQWSEGLGLLLGDPALGLATTTAMFNQIASFHQTYKNLTPWFATLFAAIDQNSVEMLKILIPKAKEECPAVLTNRFYLDSQFKNHERLGRMQIYNGQGLVQRAIETKAYESAQFLLDSGIAPLCDINIQTVSDRKKSFNLFDPFITGAVAEKRKKDGVPPSMRLFKSLRDSIHFEMINDQGMEKEEALSFIDKAILSSGKRLLSSKSKADFEAWLLTNTLTLDMPASDETKSSVKKHTTQRL